MIESKIKEAIESSGFTAEQIEVEAEMSISNLQKNFKRDSIKTKYLVRICKKLQVPYSALLEPDNNGAGQTQTANKVKSNLQSISNGGGSA